MKRIGIIGRVADGAELYDGQTVTTRLLRDAFIKALPEGGVFCTDTYDYKHHAATCLSRAVKCMFLSTHICILLSRNGLTFFLPFLYYLNKVFRRKLYHRVIGGSLDQLVEEHPRWVKYLNAFEVNWVELPSLKENLHKLCIKNAEVSPTFRNSGILALEELPRFDHAPFMLCTFSRVTKAKGIPEAIKAVVAVNQKLGTGTVRLHIYGPIEDAYAGDFKRLLAECGADVEYKGCVPYQDSVATLKSYYLHLFPTTWQGEGFPGTLTDCFCAGLPTIATDWKYNKEILSEGETGFCYDWHRPERLAELIAHAVQNPGEIQEMKKRCLLEAEKYQPDVIMRGILDFMGVMPCR